MNAPRMLRVVALVIAGLAAFDPGCVRARRDRPLVSVVAGVTSTDSARAQAIERALTDRFTLVAGWLPAADAMVVTGDRLPEAFRREMPSAPVFILRPGRALPDLRVRALRAPVSARVGERIVLEAYLAYVATRGDSLELAVRRDGLLLSRETVAVEAGDHDHHQTLATIASDTGVIALDVSATLMRSNVRAAGAVLVEVHDTPIRVLSYDARPTWFGTFMRRTLAADARFAITSRTTISRTEGVAITRSDGAPPALASLPAPPALDVVVVGAANVLDDDAVAALDRWVRSGGSALLLLDDVPNPRVQRWLDIPGWRRVDQAVAQRARFTDVLGGPSIDRANAAPDLAPLLGRQWLVPTRLPANGARWMQLADSSPVVWSHRIGAGTVIVAAALDAWTFREATRSDFARTWPRVVAEAAARIAPAVSISVRPVVAAPGAWRTAEVSTRSAALDSSQGGGALTLRPSTASSNASRSAPQRLELHARGDGRWGAEWRDVSNQRGTGQLGLSSADVGRATAWVRTVEGASEVEAPHPSVLTALAAATGGRVLDTDALDTLGDALSDVLAPARRQQPWHPMRSPWWLLPFAGALVAEWWLRRRVGQP